MEHKRSEKRARADGNRIPTHRRMEHDAPEERARGIGKRGTACRRKGRKLPEKGVRAAGKRPPISWSAASSRINGGYFAISHPLCCRKGVISSCREAIESGDVERVRDRLEQMATTTGRERPRVSKPDRARW